METNSHLLRVAEYGMRLISSFISDVEEPMVPGREIIDYARAYDILDVKATIEMYYHKYQDTICAVPMLHRTYMCIMTFSPFEYLQKHMKKHRSK